MAKPNYEKYNEHILEHKNIMEKIQNMKEKIQNNDIEIDLFYLTPYFKDLFFDHLILYDISAREYFLDSLSEILFKRKR